MANGAGTALGLSIGVTNLAAATSDNAITRKPVLTLYPDRPAEIGIPAENPRLQGPGVVLTGFVNRVGDPRGVVAPDGSVHRGEVLLADGLRALAYAATGGRPLPDDVAVTYPAHWESPAVEALGAALGEIPEWSGRARPIVLIPDAAATLLAVRTNPGIPARGTVAVCDFGGSGTSITLMDADGDYRAVAPTVRHRDFSGDLIDQALLGVVVANMPTTGAFPTGTAAIGSLSRLRTGCRIAKEQLSSSTATTLTNGLTGAQGQIRLARHELDDAIRPALTGFLARLDETLARNGIRDLVAVVSSGGGANLPAITTTLARHLRVPVATTPRPQLTAAVGAALRVARGAGDATSAAPAVPATATARRRGRPHRDNPTAARGPNADADPGLVGHGPPVARHAGRRRARFGGTDHPDRRPGRAAQADVRPMAPAAGGRRPRHRRGGAAGGGRAGGRAEPAGQIGDDARPGGDHHAAGAGAGDRGTRARGRPGAVDLRHQPAGRDRDADDHDATGDSPGGPAPAPGSSAPRGRPAHSTDSRAQ
ncbi:hsp70 family protein [Mycobacterium intracellulare MIN_061107_1834]|nr:hsp70 family protein [Mycobacterium intracellulare MIN_061107_1834]